MKPIERIVGFSLILLLLAGSQICFAQQKDASTNTQYLFSTFKLAITKKKSGVELESIMNYNCLTEEMIFVRDEMRLAISNLVAIDTIIIEERKFVPVGEVFFEIIVDGEVDLFIQHKSKAKIEGEEVGYGGTSQLSNVKSVSSVRSNGQFFYMDMPENISIKKDPVIWIRDKGEMKIVYNKRTTLKAFPDIEASLKLWFKENRINFEDVADLIRMVDYINSLKSKKS